MHITTYYYVPSFTIFTAARMPAGPSRTAWIQAAAHVIGLWGNSGFFYPGFSMGSTNIRVLFDVGARIQTNPSKRDALGGGCPHPHHVGGCGCGYRIGFVLE
jgi:hypothetical protein